MNVKKLITAAWKYTDLRTKILIQIQYVDGTIEKESVFKYNISDGLLRYTVFDTYNAVIIQMSAIRKITEIIDDDMVVE